MAKTENKVVKKVEVEVEVESDVESVSSSGSDEPVVVKKKNTTKASGKKTTKAESNGTKKNKSAYVFFCIDERSAVKEDNPELNNKEIMTELGRRWKLLKGEDEERFAKYEKLAAEDKKRYEEEKKGKATEPVASKGAKVSKKKAVKQESAETKPKVTRINGYINYCKANRERVKTENPSLTPNEVTKALSVEWKALTDGQREEYKQLS